MKKLTATVATVAAQLEGLQKGETLLVQALKTSDPEKVQLEFAEKTQALEGNAGALLGAFNKSDERFTNGARRAWMTAQISEVAEFLDIDCSDDAKWENHPTRKGKEVLPIGIMNPTFQNLRLRVQILETTEATEYQEENIDTSAKRRGADGEFITTGGQKIFSNTVVVPLAEGAEPEHVILKADPVGTAIEDEVGM